MNTKRNAVRQAESTEVINATGLLQTAGQLADIAAEMCTACVDHDGALRQIASDILPPPLSVMVVGQVKVGKSKFLNGLSGRGGMLPSDVNPLTTVLTNLHFNRQPDPQHGVSFQFYESGEWDKLTQPREDEPEQLKQYAEEIRERVQRRFGADLEGLLGQTHRFDQVTPTILQQYVSSGLDHQQQFDDLVRVADICFDTSPFPWPIRFTDTPGVNDPCLIRDKITWQAIGESDYYLVILSAHQAMSQMDEALLKILSEKGSGRAVIFINRIDELSNVAADARLLQRSVQHDITRIFGGAPAAVLCGSALWAHYAETGDGTGISQDSIEHWVSANPALTRQLDKGLASGNQDELYSEAGADVTARYQALIASGIPQLRRFLSRVLINRACEMDPQRHAVAMLSIALRHKTEVQSAISGKSTADQKARSDKETLDEVDIFIAEELALLTLQLSEDFDDLRQQLNADSQNGSDAKISPTPEAAPDTEIPLPDDLEQIRRGFLAGIHNIKLDLIAGIRHATEAMRASFPDFAPVLTNETDCSILRRFSPDTRALWRDASAITQSTWASRLFQKKNSRPSTEAITDELLQTAQAALISQTEIVFRHYMAAISGSLPDDGEHISRETSDLPRITSEDGRAELIQAERFITSLRTLLSTPDINPQYMDQSA